MGTAADPGDPPRRVDGMPTMGLGTYGNTDPERCAASVRTALDMGYRHIDTAEMYGNEAAVGAGIAAANVAAADVFVASKLWHDSLAPDDVLATARASRSRLGVESIDLLYVHWPAGSYSAGATLPAFVELVDDGVIDRIGVSNFTPGLLEEAIDVLGRNTIFANQVELHPLLPQERLRANCRRYGVNVVGYAPLARGRVFDVPIIRTIADQYDATPAQISLAWSRAHGVTVIPKATGHDHLRENWESRRIDLAPAAVDAIDGIDRIERLVAPSFGPW